MGEMEEFQKNLALRNKLRIAADKERELGDALFKKTAANDAEQTARQAIADGGNRQRVLEAVQSAIKNGEANEKMWAESMKGGERRIAIAKSQRDLEKVDEALKSVRGDRSSLQQEKVTLEKLRTLEKHYKEEIAEGKTTFTKGEIDLARKRSAEISKSDNADMKKAGEHYERYHRANDKALELEKELGMDPTDPVKTSALDPASDDGTAVAVAADVDDQTVASLMADPDELDAMSVADAQATDAEAVATAAEADPDELDDLSVGADASASGDSIAASVEPGEPALLEDLVQETVAPLAETDALAAEIDVASADLEPQVSEPEVSVEETPLETAVAAVEPTDTSIEEPAPTSPEEQSSDVSVEA